MTKIPDESGDAILALLSDEEIDRVRRTVGEASRLADGDEYVDLAAPNNGVRRVHGAMQRTLGKILPRSAVSAETWAKIGARFGRRFAPPMAR